MKLMNDIRSRRVRCSAVSDAQSPRRGMARAAPDRRVPPYENDSQE